MTGGRATHAIVSRSLRHVRGYLDSAVLAAIGYFAMTFPVAAPLWLTAGAVLAAVLSVGRERVAEVTDLRYFAAPLYGREVARAHAIATSVRIVVAGALIAATLALGAGGGATSSAWIRLAVYVLAILAAALVAVLGCLRTQRERWLYVFFAIDAGLVVDALGFSGTILGVAAAVVAAGAIGFAALRALGETLARYDPID